MENINSSETSEDEGRSLSPDGLLGERHFRGLFLSGLGLGGKARSFY